MSANRVNTSICPCNLPQYGPIVFNTVAYQRSANNIYASKASEVAAATTGNLLNSIEATGKPMFKSDYERMQFLLGKIGLRASKGTKKAGTPPQVFALDSN